jgi:hypothetical protein
MARYSSTVDIENKDPCQDPLAMLLLFYSVISCMKSVAITILSVYLFSSYLRSDLFEKHFCICSCTSYLLENEAVVELLVMLTSSHSTPYSISSPVQSPRKDLPLRCWTTAKLENGQYH